VERYSGYRHDGIRGNRDSGGGSQDRGQ
jgi:hypothetical protein